jgi:multiple sugar transport system ATP-binding protein
MNLIKALLVQDGGGLALDIQHATRSPVRIGLPDMPSAMSAHMGSEVIAGIRAEAVTLAGPGTTAAKTERAFEARVEVIEPTGADTLAVLDLNGHEFTVRLEPDVSLKPGQEARFFVDLAKLVCFDPRTETLIA